MFDPNLVLDVRFFGMEGVYIYIYTHENKACTGTIQTHTAIANVTAYMHDGRPVSAILRASLK
jgi:predicted transposase YbfD/YdcC